MKAEVDTEERMVNLVKEGVYINNFHHNVSMWTFKSLICYKCQMPGHVAKNCEPSSKQICNYCGGEHSFKDCTTRKDKVDVYCQACNLKNDHESGDKRCPKMVLNFNKRNQTYASIAAINNIAQVDPNQTRRHHKSTTKQSLPYSSVEKPKQYSDKMDRQEDDIQTKLIKCIQDFFINQTRINESFQKKDSSKVIELFKRHFNGSIVDRCKAYINQTINDCNFYEKNQKKKETNLDNSFDECNQQAGDLIVVNVEKTQLIVNKHLQNSKTPALQNYDLINERVTAFDESIQIQTKHNELSKSGHISLDSSQNDGPECTIEA